MASVASCVVFDSTYNPSTADDIGCTQKRGSVRIE